MSNSDSDLSVVNSGDTEVVADKKDEAVRRVTRVRELTEQSNELFLNYAEEMYHINKDSLHHFVENPRTGKKYTSFKEFVTSETEYQHRTSRYMISIWEWYVIEHDRAFIEELQKYGWTKLSKLVGKLTPDNYDSEWKDKLEDLSVRQLESELKDGKDPSPDGDGSIDKEPSPEDQHSDPTNRVVLQLFDSQYSNLNRALKVAGSITDSNSKGENLECICLEFLSKHHNTMGKARPLNDYLSAIEENFGISLVALKTEQGELGIAYGSDHIDDLVSEPGD